MNFSNLEDNIFYVIKEQEIKLGYIKSDTRLFYPLKCLNSLLDTNIDFETAIPSLNTHFNNSKNYANIKASIAGDRIRLDIPASIVEYIHKSDSANTNFLHEFTSFIQKENINFEETFELFKKYSKSTKIIPINSNDFDYIVYFTDSKPDNFIYCLKNEGKHISYHRFTKEDFNDLDIYKLD